MRIVPLLSVLSFVAIACGSGGGGSPDPAPDTSLTDATDAKDLPATDPGNVKDTADLPHVDPGPFADAEELPVGDPGPGSDTEPDLPPMDDAFEAQEEIPEVSEAEEPPEAEDVPEAETCQPSCDGECGPDGCGDSCGSCDPEAICIQGWCAVRPAPGTLVITEILIDPSVTPELGAEWFEVYNASPDTIALFGLTVRDLGGEKFVVGAEVALEPDRYFVFARQSASGPGFDADYLYGSMSLANTSDEIVLDYDGKEIDSVAWKAPAWKIPSGAALSLSADRLTIADNDMASNWCPAIDAIGGTSPDKGTPGKENPVCTIPCVPACTGKSCGDDGCEGSCGACKDGFACAGGTCVPADGESPQAGDLLITELMINPKAADDSYGEWIEIRNLSAKKIQLYGVEVDTGEPLKHAIQDARTVEAGGLAVVARKADPTLNGGFVPDVVVPALSLGNDGDTVVILFGGLEIDRVTYSTAAGWTVPNGAALSLDPIVVLPGQNDFSGSWCPAGMPMSGGDLGSPGQPNASCSPVE